MAPGKSSLFSKEHITSRRGKLFVSAIVAMLAIVAFVSVWFYIESQREPFTEISIRDVLDLTSERDETEELVICSDEDPVLALVASPAACWYDIGGEGDERAGLKPMLIAVDGELDVPHMRVIRNTGASTALVIGEVDYSGGGNFEASGDAYDVSLEVAQLPVTVNLQAVLAHAVFWISSVMGSGPDSLICSSGCSST